MQTFPTPSVLDASALLAHALREPGFEIVAGHIPVASVSTVNWSEFLQKLIYRGVPADSLIRDYASGGLNTVDFREAHARRAADLWPATTGLGISLADRACMALAIELGLPILTADRRWADLDLPVVVQSIR